MHKIRSIITLHNLQHGIQKYQVNIWIWIFKKNSYHFTRELGKPDQNNNKYRSVDNGAWLKILHSLKYIYIYHNNDHGPIPLLITQ